MSQQFQLVSAIIAELQYRADIQGQDSRHPPANLLRSFNDSAQKLRTKLTDMGFEWWLTFTAPQALSLTVQATGETFTEESWPIDCARIYGVHVLIQAGMWAPLKPITLQGMRDYQGGGNYLGFFGGQSGTPQAFALRLAPFGAAAVETAGKIVLVPASTVARQFRLLYLPVFAPLVTTDTFNALESHVEWIIWDMAVKVAARDNDARGTAAIALKERELLEESFSRMAQRTQMAASMEPRRADLSENNYGGIRELT